MHSSSSSPSIPIAADSTSCNESTAAARASHLVGPWRSCTGAGHERGIPSMSHRTSGKRSTAITHPSPTLLYAFSTASEPSILCRRRQRRGNGASRPRISRHFSTGSSCRRGCRQSRSYHASCQKGEESFIGKAVGVDERSRREGEDHRQTSQKVCLGRGMRRSHTGRATHHALAS